MSLLTGEMRGANAVALTASIATSSINPGLEGIISRRSDLAEDMSVVMAHREMELSAVRERLDLETSRLKEGENQMQLLTRIRRFFAIDNSSARAQKL